MNTQTRLQALSAFLKAQRAKLTPQSVGLPEGTRRRTPGLRREEVAQLAGVSSTWYTWLEQGRDIQASLSVLDSIAEALRLTPDERKYLIALASDSGIGTALHVPEPAPRVTPSLEKILAELRYCPTIISDRRCQIVGWNAAAAHVFLDFDAVPPEQRNMIRLLFARKEFRRLAVNWEQFASGFLAIFRAYYGQYVEDDWYDRFLAEMSGLYPDFERLWHDSRVNSAPEVVLEFRHAKAGKMLFDLTSLQVHGSADLRMSVYTPAFHTPTETKLRRLVGE
ncbi:helix-turn-helix transcriptional regulator [Cohnella sp. REN36]|uniref:helix-turn-helix transcriptional regulator n=1 Tax=Cohnella sp. REN36 TaxID=2887347 RepID=UPI001D156DBB|nr:helix-turn-helix transcriptional regulator [Cohnella sp. REN36]MCC3375109.1 helix-turn-helix transcriptional regulator [Cohnella sp. REN36]